jgi:hypothetical protein
MIEVATAINNFASQATQTDFVPPSDESVFILTSSQLQDLIKEAIQPLQDRIGSLEARIAIQNEKIASLEATQAHAEESQLIQLRLINDLRESKKVPGKTETSRAEKIEKYLASRPDHRATFETLKGYLGIDNDLLGIAIRSLLSSGKYAIIKTPGDRRKRTLVMSPR